MFTNLSDSAKALGFFVLAFGLTVLVSSMAPLLGNATMLLHMYSPAAAALLMLLVVTRDGYSREAWRGLGLYRAGVRSWPLALLGNAGGKLKVDGRYLRFPKFDAPGGRTLPDLYCSLATALGVPTSTFGMGGNEMVKGPIELLMA